MWAIAKEINNQWILSGAYKWIRRENEEMFIGYIEIS